MTFPIANAGRDTVLRLYRRTLWVYDLANDKGRRPVKLNMGDCFAYACAKSLGAKLLFKGDDFTKSDIARLT